MGLFDRGSQ
ncbi:hypothetical protein LINPERPRIM_LOCUS7211 [Linum perenne]